MSNASAYYKRTDNGSIQVRLKDGTIITALANGGYTDITLDYLFPNVDAVRLNPVDISYNDQSYIRINGNDIPYYTWYQISEDTTANFSVATCLAGDTLVLMADGTLKRIDAVEVGDKVISIDSDRHMQVGEVIFSDKDEEKYGDEYVEWTFSDGTTARKVKTINRHRFYNIERQAYTYMDEWNVGEHTIDFCGNRLALIDSKTVQEKTRHFKITVDKYHNYFANGILTGSRLTPALNRNFKI